MSTYRIHYRGRWHSFDTLEAAQAAARRVFQRANIVVTIVKVPERADALGFCRDDLFAHARTPLCRDWKVRQ